MLHVRVPLRCAIGMSRSEGTLDSGSDWGIGSPDGGAVVVGDGSLGGGSVEDGGIVSGASNGMRSSTGDGAASVAGEGTCTGSGRGGVVGYLF